MAVQTWRIGTLAIAATLALAGCSSDEGTPTTSSPPPAASDGPGNPSAPPTAGSQTPAPAPVPPAATPGSGTNSAPVLSGSPAQSATAGEAWSFLPDATDPDGDTVSWSIVGKPADAVFSTATGQLLWTPSDAGAWHGIVISAVDSRGAAASLPPFSVVVNPPRQIAGTATLSWDMPQQYTDGQPLPPEDQVAGYRVYHGAQADALDKVVPVDSATTLQYTAANLPAGTHYFAVSAISVNGAEGERSEVLSKTVM